MPAAVLITGGSRRIGKAIARGMAQDGYTVLLHYHHSEEAARETAKQMEASGVVCHMLKASLSNASQVQTLIEQAFQIEPQCNLLVNNAAVFEAGSLMETTGALLERSWQVNLNAPLLLMQGFLPPLPNGRIHCQLTRHSDYSKLLHPFCLFYEQEDTF